MESAEIIFRNVQIFFAQISSYPNKEYLFCNSIIFICWVQNTEDDSKPLENRIKGIK